MTCAKKIIKCTIITPEGELFTGENACGAPQPACPRNEDEGYEKCSTTCKQPGHAEIMALRKAGELARGATAHLTGTYNCCKACARALYEAGVRQLVIAMGRE